MMFVVDVESDGPCPGLYSMISFGAVLLDGNHQTTFLGEVHPLEGAARIEEAAAVSGVSREKHESFEYPGKVMKRFKTWIEQNNSEGRATMISDNPAFDWQFINYYFHKFVGDNPFGFSARRIGDIYSGLAKNLKASSDWKKLRETKHDHNPVNDSIGNAEAIIKFCKKYNVTVPGVNPTLDASDSK